MVSPAPPQRRVVLLLQGPRSPFFARLADALAARGAEPLRVLFCPGDALFWLGRKAIRHRSGEAGWAERAARLIEEHGVTDVVGLGDGRALHALAYRAARRAGARVHVVEQGFLRPGWLTVEPDALARWRPSAQALAATDATLPQAPPVRAPFAAFAAMDVAYDLANIALRWAFYPGYRSHIPHGPLTEWAGWARKALRAPQRRRSLRAALMELDSAKGPVFLFAMQLEADFQIRAHGPEGGVFGALGRALASFAAHAPPDARLVVKPHPLDPHLRDWPAVLRESDAAERAIWLDGGDLGALTPRLAGMVTVNSTAGLSALLAGAPVLTLGEALYDAPGLTHQAGLDAFWRAPAAPDPNRARAFAAALAREIQVPGGFDGSGMGPGAETVAERILSTPLGEHAA